MSNRLAKFQTRWLILIMAIIVCAVVVFFLLIRLHSEFPSSVSKRADFSIFYPSKETTINPLRSTISYDNQAGGVSYTVMVNNEHVVISEQSSPDIFNDGPVLQLKLQQSHQFASLTSHLGEIALTKPTGLNDQVVAVLDVKGTLIFAHALQHFTSSQWIKLFNSLQVIN
jgi:uncharacterized protein YggT (Ycf19 family)